MPVPQATQPQSPHGNCPSSRLRIDLTGGRVQLTGQLNRTTVHLLHDAISTLLLTDGVAWVIDATDVTAFDGMGVRAIGAAYRRALRHDRRIRLIGTPPALHRELTRLRLDHHLLGGDDAPTAAAPPLYA